MVRNRPPSKQTIRVLLALAEEPAAWRHGYDLCQQTGLKAGSMYPILMRLADRGFLDTTWESAVPTGRPPRHLYRLTKTGADLAREFGEDVAVTAAVRLRPRLGGAS